LGKEKGDVMAEKLKKYRHGLLLLYFPFYLAAFAYLEKKVPDKVHIINCAIDQYIPFVEVFIIPYLLPTLRLQASTFSLRKRNLFVSGCILE